MTDELPEVIFAGWAVRIEAGENLDFEDLVREHTEHAVNLRLLHEDWRLFAPLLGRVVPGLIASSAHLSVPPLSSADDDGIEPASADLLDRLGIHAPNTGRYRFRAVIGRGGGGVVLKVWDTKLNRPLAMKVVLGRGEGRPTGDTPRLDGRTLSRFVDEARIASQLNHPGIVPVHELGADETGRAFFTMKLVRGENLAAVFQHVKSGKDDWNQTRALAVMLRVSEAMAFAHDKGVIHRDLKPANIMVGRYGEVYVMDWGLARVLTESEPDATSTLHSSSNSAVDSLRASDLANYTLSTRDGDAIGTPSYMPPEQANGDTAHMDERSDVFALGAILCELLTGSPPYTGSQHETLLMASRARLERTQERLRTMAIDERLRDLTLHCLQPIAEDRPRNAGEVARRLSAYLDSLEQRAQEAEIVAATNTVKAIAAKRSQHLTLALALSVLATFILGALAVWRIQTQRTERRLEANQQVSRALSDTRTQLGNAERAPHYDSSLWAVAASSAERIHIFADSESTDSHLKAEARSLAAEVQDQHTSAHAQFTIAERNQALHDELISLRSKPFEGDSSHETWIVMEAERLSSSYDLAFSHRLGSSLLHHTVDDALLQLSQTFDPVSIAAHLDIWALARDRVRPQDATDYDDATHRVRKIAERLDPGDEWRGRLRRLLPDTKNQRAAIEALASNAHTSLLPAISTMMLSEALWECGARDAAVSTLRLGAITHPSDFALAFQLGLRLQQRTPPDWHDSFEAYSIARALRPDIGEVRHRLAIACEHIGKLDQAVTLFESLLTESPDNPEWLRHLASCLIDDGQHNRAAVLIRHLASLEQSDLHDLVQLGHLQLAQGDSTNALATFHKASSADHASHEPHYGVGMALLRLDRTPEAIAAFQRALAIDPNDAYSHHNLAEAMESQGDTVNAEVHYRRAAEIDPRWTEPLQSWARLLGALKRPAEAIPLYRRILAITPEDTSSRIRLSFELDHVGANDLASIEMVRASQYNPKSDQPHYWIGRAQLEKGLVAESITSFRWATELDPQDTNNWISLGSALESNNRPEEAITALQQAISIDAQSSAAYHELGHLLQSQGRTEEALEAYRCATATASQRVDPEVLCHIAAIMYRAGAYEQASLYAHWALQIAPDDSSAHSLLADVLTATSKAGQAIEHRRYELQLDPEDASAHRKLGELLMTSGSLHEAQNVLSRASELDPLDPSTCIALAVNALRLDALDEAGYWSNEAMAVAPDSLEALHNMGHTLQSQGRPREALVAYSRAASMNPSDVELQMHVGETLLTLKDAVAAQRALAQSVQVIPSSAPLWYLLGRAYRQSGDLANARLGFEEARRLYATSADAGSAEWVVYADRTLSRLNRMLSRLDNIVAGTRSEIYGSEPADTCDAALLQYWKLEFVSAATLYAAAYAAELPVHVALDHGHIAATAAAMASRGDAGTTEGITVDRQISFKRDAIARLKERLALVDDIASTERTLLTSEVLGWANDSDLAAIRDTPFLETAPPDIQADAAALWSAVRSFTVEHARSAGH